MQDLDPSSPFWTHKNIGMTRLAQNPERVKKGLLGDLKTISNFKVISSRNYRMFFIYYFYVFLRFLAFLIYSSVR